MRLVHVDCGATMQGGQWQVLYLLRGLRERGHSQILLARAELAERARAEGFEVAEPGPLRSCDLVHVHDARGHTLAAWRARSPIVVSRRVGFAVKTGILSKWKYRRAAHYIAVSRFVAAKLMEAGLKAETISVVYDGVPIPPYREPAFQGPILAILKDPLAGLLKEAAQLSGVRIRDVKDMVDDVKTVSALAYITAVQGLGSAAIAALAAGVPVVASRAGGLPEVIEHERTGLLVENSVPEITAALTRITSDRELARRLSWAGYEEAAARFSDTAMVEATERIYEKVLG